MSPIGVAGAFVVTLGLLSPESAHATAFTGGYNKSALTVAKQIGCRNTRQEDGGGRVKSSLVCDLRGERINVITFRSEGQQTSWLDDVDLAFPNGGYVGVARGVVIVAYNGNRRAASAGAAALNGAVVPVGG